MNFLKRGLWAAVATAAVAGGASAQVGGATGGLGGLGGLGGGATGGLGGLGGLLGGGGGQGGGGGGGAGVSVNNQILNIAPSTNIVAPSTIAQPPQSIATSNAIGRYYANPSYQGRAGSNTSSALNPGVVAPGGFGTALFGTTGGAANNATGGRGGAGGGGFGGTTTGFGGAATGAGGGGFGGTTGGLARGGGGVGGAGGGGGAGQAGQGQVVNQGAPGISYTATIKFDTPTVTPAQFQADLQAVINRTSSLSNPAGVQLTVAPNGRVNVRGRVKDEDEARLVEGLLRITPGVRDVTNELQYPSQ